MSLTDNLHAFQEFTKLELIAREVVEGFITGLHKSPFHGFSVEFAEHRLYNTGESTRHIDWKLYARTEKLFVKRYEEETNLRCQIVIDNSSSMYFPFDQKGDGHNKMTFSVYAAAAIIHLLRKQRDAFGLSVFADKLSTHTPAKSNPVHAKFLFHELEKLMETPPKEERKKSFTTEALHRISDNIHRRSLVIIFTDMLDNSGAKDDEIFSALQHLRHNKHEVVLFHVTDKSKEIDFEFENRPYHFIDMETGEELKLNPNEVKDAYVKSATEYEKELKLRCGQYRVDFVEADINQGFRQVLLPYLLKRQKMF